jgi:hypothetical protein
MADPVASEAAAVQERVDDAQALWAGGRREGAFLLALIAVVVRARRDFPPPTSESEAFRRFIESRLSVRLSVEYRGTQWPIERVFYNWLRCELVHQGGLPVDISFKDDAAPGERSVRAGGAPEYVLLVSPGWFDHLVEWALS